MINFFRKRNSINKEDISFLQAITSDLPSKYLFLQEQISPDFILGKKPNELGDEGTYRLQLNADLEDKYSDKSYPYFFILENIRIWSDKKQSYDYVELHILQGMLAGFKVNCDYKNLNLNKIDVSEIREKHFKGGMEDFIELTLDDVNPKLISYLDIDEGFIIDIKEGEFFVIKNLEDGNHIAINKEGEVYGLIHDPYTVEKLYDSVQDLLGDIETGEFSFEKYLDQKMR